MSHDKNTTNPVILASEQIDQTPEGPVAEAKVRFTKTRNFVSTHKNKALAGLGLAALTGVAAFVGRVNAPETYVGVTIAPESDENESVDNTVVAPETT